MYKPRTLAADVALARFLAALRQAAPWLRIDIPAVLDRGEYGWARLIPHRYCADDREQRGFYRSLGHWLAVLRLLGGTDMHAGNIVACGPVPYIVDCETLFTPYPPARASGYGQATDHALEAVRALLRTRLLPMRRADSSRLDLSAAGNLAGQQPARVVAAIVDAGLDTARLGTRPADPQPVSHQPSAVPQPRRFWPDVLTGFDELTDRLVALDTDGRLSDLLVPFRSCRVRIVPRDTARYGEFCWALWHPVSLHDEPATVRRVTELMRAEPGSPHDPDVIAAEIADMLAGDVPVFTAQVGGGAVDGPRGTRWATVPDLTAAALTHWRAADRRQEREVARASLAGAYLDGDHSRDAEPGAGGVAHWPARAGDVERRRRKLAATLIAAIRDTAIRGQDGTAAWITPVPDGEVRRVQATGLDLYSGTPGVAVLLAGYLGEERSGRADPVAGIAELLDATLRTTMLREDATASLTPWPGGHLGVGGRIWSWLTLAALGHQPADCLARATALAQRLAEDSHAAGRTAGGSRFPAEVFGGRAGTAVPLLTLAAVTGEACWARLATTLATGLAAGHDGAADRPSGAGFAHGSAGVGWALARIAVASGEPPGPPGPPEPPDLLNRIGPGGWCAGAAGAGLAAIDLMLRTRDIRYRQIARRAAEICHAAGPAGNSTLCHGDLGTWELLDAAVHNGLAPAGLNRGELESSVLTRLEQHGPALDFDTAAPGLLAGQGGIAYQLLRMHPECDLPSVLLLGERFRTISLPRTTIYGCH